MGILSKLKKRKGGEVKEDVDEARSINDIVDMAKEGLKEFDIYYDKIYSKDEKTFALNLGITMSNYCLFRIKAYRKYGFDRVDEALKEIDYLFMKKIAEVIKRWMRQR